MTDLFADTCDTIDRKTVSVLLPCPVERAYSYLLPVGMQVEEGAYVRVPFRSREMNGVVWAVDEALDVKPAKLKEVVEIYATPPMPAEERAFIDRTARYTMAPVGMVLKMALSAPKALEEQKSVTAYVAPPSPQPSPRGGEGDSSNTLSLRGRGQGEGGYQPKVPQLLIERARELRENQTDAEKLLWYCLKNRQFCDLKFRRQHSIPPYITDFACLEKKLVIELDGGQHTEEKDRKRTKFLEGQGYKVVRFWNNDVLSNPENVLETLYAAVQDLALSPHPSPRRGEGVSLSPKRQKVLDILADGLPRKASQIAEEAGCSASVVRAMADKELIETVSVMPPAPCMSADPYKDGVDLSDMQAEAAGMMSVQVETSGFVVTLLDGVTGAGKTEVYFEAVAAALKDHKQVMILLPEIALTDAFVSRFQKRFGCRPALWHSGLTPAQRRDTWRGVALGRTKVVAGARSALFLPYADLGLIIVDEEHENAYKQEDGVRYHARDMAVLRASCADIPIVLASATPSLETMANVWKGKYTHIQLTSRHGGATLPDVQIIDLKIDKPERQSFISPPLKEALTQSLKRGEQSLLFLNRRGYAPLSICRNCGEKMECPNCTAWLVEHKHSNRLQCHHCGYILRMPKNCPECDAEDSLAPCGPGVERIAEEVQGLFPDARVRILSSDISDDTADIQQSLQDIQDGKVDIIVGTQIIAKGHHFPMLTCVGVVDADLGLQGGDLRAAERTYQLLHQVAGRAGREERSGTVLIQTTMPENKVIKALAAWDRESFYGVEARERQLARMPPYGRLAGIIISGLDEAEVDLTAQQLGRLIPRIEGVRILGPAPAPIAVLRNRHRRRFLVQGGLDTPVQPVISQWLARGKWPSSVTVTVDIDPVSFL